MEYEAQSPKRRSRRVWIWSGVGVAVVAVALGVGFAVKNAQGNGGKDKKKNGDETPAAPVELYAVSQGNISTHLQTTATLEARHSAVLVARRQGQVKAIYAEEGQWVKNGAVLAVLDDTEAKVALERAKVSVEIARRDFERGEKLKERGLISEKDLDDQRLKLRTAEVELEQARYDYGQTRLTAPFAGRIAARMVKLGETVTVGKDCFRVVDYNPLRAQLYFAERELSRVKVGQPAVLTLDSHPGKQFEGRVEIVNPVVDETNGTFKVTLQVPNGDGLLPPGSFARVRLKTGDYADALLMPRRGVIQEDGEDYVFVAHGDTVAKIPVTLGAIDGDTAQILAGLAPGDSVVTIGQGGLKPGAKIKPVSF